MKKSFRNSWRRLSPLGRASTVAAWAFSACALTGWGLFVFAQPALPPWVWVVAPAPVGVIAGCVHWRVNAGPGWRRARQLGGVFLAVVLPAAVTAFAVGLVAYHLTAPPHARPRATPSPAPAPETGGWNGVAAGWLNGVAVAQFHGLSSFTRATGEIPQVVAIYTGLTDRWPAGEIQAIARAGAIPLVQINPRGQSLTQVAAGRYDPFLRLIAGEIRSGGLPVAVSFAHEANGDWYPWGCGRSPASVYVAAWRHVHQVIGVRDVTWVWTTDHGWKGSRCPLTARYPGARFVDWIGIDGYLRKPADTFGSIFGASVRVLHALGKPVLLTEAGVPAGPRQPARIRSLFAGARHAQCIGVVYFDSATRKGNYRPQANPAALAAYRSASQAAAAPLPGEFRFTTGGTPPGPQQGGNNP